MSSLHSRRGVLTSVPISGDETCGYSVPPPANCSTTQTSVATLLPFWGTQHKPAPLVLQQGQTIRESISRSLKQEQVCEFVRFSQLPPGGGGQIWSSLGRPLLYQRPDNWGITFYTRIGLKGSFHTYPHVGGPFQSLAEANDAIEHYLSGRRDKQMFVGLFGVELAVQQCLYWPDGRRKQHLASQPIDTSRHSECQLAEALLDKYNEDHNLLGGLAYEFRDIMCCQSIRTEDRVYDHINFTATTKGADDLNCCTAKLFFAEVMYNQSSRELFVICLCMLDHTDDGYCYGCKCNGNPDMKHPRNTSLYMAGHTSSVSGRSYCRYFDDEDNEDELEAQKARLRWMFGGSHEVKQIEALSLEGQRGTPCAAKRMRAAELPLKEVREGGLLEGFLGKGSLEEQRGTPRAAKRMRAAELPL